MPFDWVWEIKYVKKKDEKNVALVAEKREESRGQLESYRRSHLFAARTDVRYLSVLFIGKSRVEVEEYPAVHPPCP
jgi:hypothetical protein